MIKIENKKALDKFYHRLFFYKHCKNIETNYKELKSIIKAINIKKRKEKITYIYDEACKQIDNHYKNKDICGFKNNKCYVQQKLNNGNINGCCRMCIYQSTKGCMTKNLTCKLFTCSEVEKRCKIIKFDDLKILKLLSFRNRLILKHDYFSKREDVINDLYYGSIILWTLRIIIRLINNFYTLKYKK